MSVSPIILLMAIAAMAVFSDRGATAAPSGPDSPTAAIHSLARAYGDRSIQEFAALLSADYRFHSNTSGVAGMGVFVDGFTREHELTSASELFGVAPREGAAGRPAATRITATLDSLSEGPDPEHPDSTSHFRVVAARRFQLGISLASGDTIVTGPGLHVFHLVRGDAAIRVEGQPADSSRWYFRRWLEDVAGVTLALAEKQGGCGDAVPNPGVSARSEGGAPVSPASAGAPVNLAIHPLGNPACPTLKLTCDLPGTEPGLLEVFDVTGRMMNRRNLPSLAPGTVRVEAGVGARIMPGVYWVRLSQGARRPTTKMIVVAR